MKMLCQKEMPISAKTHRYKKTSERMKTNHKDFTTYQFLGLWGGNG